MPPWRLHAVDRSTKLYCPGMAWLLYQALMVTLLAAAAPFLVLRRGRHHLATLCGRLGLYPAVDARDRLWIHAVSVGEVTVASTLVRSLPATLPLVITTVTPTGQAVARRVFEGRADVAYLPFDVGPPVRRFLDTFTPSALVLIEGDLWPLALARCKQRGLPVVVVNGRISDRSFPRLRRLKPLLGPLLGPVSLFVVQTGQDRDRLLRLGVPEDKVRLAGNIKFDSPDPPRLSELEALIRRLADRRPILVAGSTMPGEEEKVLDAFLDLAPREAFLILAPRHPERCTEVQRIIAARGLSLLRRSRLSSSEAPQPGPAVLLLDTLGELAALYRLADSVFIGGSLVPRGGHNPLEAARFGVPIAAGPSMENFPEIASRLDSARAWRRPTDSRALARTWKEWLADPAGAQAHGQRALRVCKENQGAVDRTLRLIQPFLERARP